MSSEIQFEFVCTQMPGVEHKDRRALRLGIQAGKEVVEDVPADSPQPIFQFRLRVNRNDRTGQPNFLGPYAHGTPRDRFVYLCWGERNGESWEPYGRAKVPLHAVTWHHIDTATQTHKPIRAVIHMTGDKGGPIFATIKADKMRWEV